MISLIAIPIPTQYFRLSTLKTALEGADTGQVKISLLFYQQKPVWTDIVQGWFKVIVGLYVGGGTSWMWMKSSGFLSFEEQVAQLFWAARAICNYQQWLMQQVGGCSLNHSIIKQHPHQFCLSILLFINDFSSFIQGLPIQSQGSLDSSIQAINKPLFVLFPMYLHRAHQAALFGATLILSLNHDVLLPPTHLPLHASPYAHHLASNSTAFLYPKSRSALFNHYPFRDITHQTKTKIIVYRRG